MANYFSSLYVFLFSYLIYFCLFLYFSSLYLTCTAFIVNDNLSSVAFVSPSQVYTLGGLQLSNAKRVSSSLHTNMSNKINNSVHTDTFSRGLRAINTKEEKFENNIIEQNEQFGRIDLRGKVAFIAGVGDSTGYGWAIAKQLASAGAIITVGTWPPVLSIFKKSLEMGKFDKDAKLDNGNLMKIQKIYPLDAAFDKPEDITDDIRNNKRYAGLEGFTISEVAEKVKTDYGKIDILVHSLANGPEVTKELSETSRKGYLSAISSSSFSFVSLLQHFSPIMNKGGAAVALSYIASERVIPGYGGGMSSAKAALESDTKTLAYELGRKYDIRVNAISAGPLKSRAASAIGSDGGKSFIEYAIDYSIANAPLQQHLYAEDVGNSALFLLSQLSRGVTGVTLYVDNGLHVMGQAIDSIALQKPVS